MLIKRFILTKDKKLVDTLLTENEINKFVKILKSTVS